MNLNFNVKYQEEYTIPSFTTKNVKEEYETYYVISRNKLSHTFNKNGQVLAACDEIKVIATMSVGADHLDIQTMKGKGIR